MTPRRTPMGPLTKSPKVKTKETWKASQNNPIEIKIPLEEYVPIIQFTILEEHLPQPILKDT
jgi:hypothetical protein